MPLPDAITGPDRRNTVYGLERQAKSVGPLRCLRPLTQSPKRHAKTVTTSSAVIVGNTVKCGKVLPCRPCERRSETLRIYANSAFFALACAA